MATQSGHIFQINVSNGGVPKRSIPVGEVTESGVMGDRQRNRRHHGGPTRALCLYSLERILALQAEGHPNYPGATGENDTIAGLDWEQLQPGMVLRLGEEVTIELTSFTVPCSNIEEAFTGRHFVRISQKMNPGWSRLYARVLQPGQIRPGDAVVVLEEVPEPA